VVLKAIGETKLRSQEVVLKIIGNGQYEARLRELVQEMELEDKVAFVGYVEDKDKYLYYSAADLFIYPELTSPAFGLVAAEAMACATTVISTNHEATKEVIGDEDYLFKVHDSNELACKITTFLNQSDKQQENIAKKFYDRQKRLFAYSRMIQNTMDIYKIVIRG
jgi:glycosyltransferase involved in cell wall biosynthesis